MLSETDSDGSAICDVQHAGPASTAYCSRLTSCYIFFAIYEREAQVIANCGYSIADASTIWRAYVAS